MHVTSASGPKMGIGLSRRTSASPPCLLPGAACSQTFLAWPLGRCWPGTSVLGLRAFVSTLSWRGPSLPLGQLPHTGMGVCVAYPVARARWTDSPTGTGGSTKCWGQNSSCPLRQPLGDGWEALESASLRVGSVCPLAAVAAVHVGPPLPALTAPHRRLADRVLLPLPQGRAASSGRPGCISARSRLTGAGVSASLPGLWFGMRWVDL